MPVDNIRLFIIIGMNNQRRILKVRSSFFPVIKYAMFCYKGKTARGVSKTRETKINVESVEGKIRSFNGLRLSSLGGLLCVAYLPLTYRADGAKYTFRHTHAHAHRQTETDTHIRTHAKQRRTRTYARTHTPTTRPQHLRTYIRTHAQGGCTYARTNTHYKTLCSRTHAIKVFLAWWGWLLYNLSMEGTRLKN